MSEADDGSIDIDGLATPGQSKVLVKIGNREYSMIRSTRCGICMHPGRYAIEEKLLLNFGYPAIIRFVSDQEVRKDTGEIEVWPQITAYQLKNHREAGHIGLNASMIDEITRKRAQAEGFDVEKSFGSYVDHIAVTRGVLNRGAERMIRGEIEPDMKDTLAAAKILNDLENTNKQFATMEQYQELILLFWRTTQEVVGQDQFQKIMGRLSNHPVVRQFQQQRTIEGEVS